MNNRKQSISKFLESINNDSTSMILRMGAGTDDAQINSSL